MSAPITNVAPANKNDVAVFLEKMTFSVATPPIEISIFEKFQNYRRKFVNSSFDWLRVLYSKNIKTGQFLIKLTCDEALRLITI